jgi:uncharacterized membrane protein YkoI
MHRTLGRLCLTAAAGLVLLATVAPAGEKVPLDQVPKAVMDAVKARFPGAKISSVEKEKEDGKVVYDIELKHEGRKYEMDILEDGTVLEIEKEIAAKDLPGVVSKALQAAHPKATVKEVMEVYKVKGKEEKLDHYEVTLETADRKELEVTVSLDGKVGKAAGDKK